MIWLLHARVRTRQTAQGGGRPSPATASVQKPAEPTAMETLKQIREDVSQWDERTRKQLKVN